MAETCLKAATVSHILFLPGCRAAMAALPSLAANSNRIQEMPMAASTFASPSDFSVLTATRYGASRVLTLVIPNVAGACVSMMVMLAEVVKAEIGM